MEAWRSIGNRHSPIVNPEAQLEQLRRGVVEIISERALLEKLSRQQPLIIKAGFDPTAPDLHLGHTVLLRKLRQFQDLGHKVIFLIGDATALVGDPSGKSQTRPRLTPDDVDKNARTYVQQISKIKILNTEDNAVFEQRHNNEWFEADSFGGAPISLSPGEPPHRENPRFGFSALMGLLSRYTVARLIERDDFQKRMKAGQEVSMLELFYPLMQGYDSVQLEADVELGGTDQKFNLLVGRDLQRAYGQEPQVVMTLPLLVGVEGVEKMSKSLGNHIGITDKPDDMFGKIMSIPDGLMESYVTLLTDLEWSSLAKEHPMAAKAKLAKDVVTQYYDDTTANRAAESFDRVIRDKKIPVNIPEIRITNPCVGVQDSLGNLWEHDHDRIRAAINQHLGIESKTQLRQLIEQKGFKIDGQPVVSIDLQLNSGSSYVLQRGPRRFLKISLK